MMALDRSAQNWPEDMVTEVTCESNVTMLLDNETPQPHDGEDEMEYLRRTR